MKKISVIISSLRPERLEEAIDSTAMHADLVEIVVASPTPPRERDFVTHVPVPGPDDPNELSWSQKNNLAVEHASGDYIVFNNDDIHFREGWAPVIINHMEKYEGRKGPYLAAFQIATKGELIPRHTAFGMLYANHGCVRKSDLSLVGGTLFDERFWLGYNDIDLSLRVWNAGGEVELYDDLVLDADRDKPHRATNPYRAKHYTNDANMFMKIWFPRFFWKFVANYNTVKGFFSVDDGVLPAHRQTNGAFLELVVPYAVAKCFQRIGLGNVSYATSQRNRVVRIINRRWHSLYYECPPALKKAFSIQPYK